MSYNTHCFNVELAKLIGLAEAIVLQHFYFWHQRARNLPDMNREGRVWFYRSVAEMRDVFPYLSDANVRTAIQHLIDRGLVTKGDFSEKSMYKATWYSLNDSAIRAFDLAESTNPFIEPTNGFAESANVKDNRNIDYRKDTTKEYTYSASRGFVPPSVEDVRAYCEERRNGISAQQFVDYYTANGWMVGKSKMKDWRAAVRNWETRRRDNPAPQAPRPAERRYLSPEERTLRALAQLQARDGQLNTFAPDEQ